MILLKIVQESSHHLGAKESTRLVEHLPNVQEALSSILALTQLGVVAHTYHPSIQEPQGHNLKLLRLASGYMVRLRPDGNT